MFCARYLISILFVTACVYSTKQGDLSSGKDVEVTINNNTEDVSKSNGKKETVDIGPTDSLHRNESLIPIEPSTPTPNSTTIDPITTPKSTTISPSTTTKSTTVSPSTTTKSTTVSPSTTSKSTTVSPSTTTKSTTVSPSTTTKSTTVSPSTTVKPNSTTTVNPTPVPSSTAKPSPDPEPSRKFDGPSFVGGIVLALGLVGIGFVAFKFYKARLEVNYHTL